jgi:hypothetical protein
MAFFILDDGLKADGTSISQIPTYVTGVPNGTEKVGTTTRTQTPQDDCERN